MYNLFFSFLTSTFSSCLLLFLVPLMVEGLTHSAFYTALAYAVSMVPYIFIMPVGGVIGDYYSKKRLLQSIELLNTLLVILFAFIPFHQRYVGLVLLLHFLLSSLHTIHHTLFQAFAPTVIQQHAIRRLTASTNLVSNLSILFAPIIGTFCYRVSHHPSILYWVAGGYGLSFLLITWVTPHTQALQPNDQPIAIAPALREGWAYVRAHPFFRYTVYIFFFVNFGETCINANLFYYLKTHAITSHTQIGYYYIPMGVGVLLGAIVAPYIIGKLRSGKIVVIGTFLTALCPLAMLLSDDPWLVTILWGINKMGATIINITFESLRQMLVPRKLLTRVIAITRMIAYLSIPIASLVSGWLFEQTGSFTDLLIISFLSITLGIAGWGKRLYFGHQ
ncbi:MAG: MFS transporter [Bacteroidota bacterium]